MSSTKHWLSLLASLTKGRLRSTLGDLSNDTVMINPLVRWMRTADRLAIHLYSLSVSVAECG